MSAVSQLFLTSGRRTAESGTSETSEAESLVR